MLTKRKDTTTFPLKSIASITISAASLIDTSSSSPTGTKAAHLCKQCKKHQTQLSRAQIGSKYHHWMLTRQNNRLDLLVLSQNPDEETREVERVYELSARRPCPPHHKRSLVLCNRTSTAMFLVLNVWLDVRLWQGADWLNTTEWASFSGKSALTFGQVHLVHETRKNVAILEIVVVMWTVDIGRDHRSEVAPMLLMICPDKRSAEKKNFDIFAKFPCFAEVTDSQTARKQSTTTRAFANKTHKALTCFGYLSFSSRRNNRSWTDEAARCEPANTHIYSDVARSSTWPSYCEDNQNLVLPSFPSGWLGYPQAGRNNRDQMNSP